jgi:hypothetical protein
VDTFLTAMGCLVATDPHCKGLLPAVVRNAERLGLLKGITDDNQTAVQEEYSDLLEKLLDARCQEKSEARIPMAKLTLPNPRYLDHPPQYFAPDPVAPKRCGSPTEAGPCQGALIGAAIDALAGAMLPPEPVLTKGSFKPSGYVQDTVHAETRALLERLDRIELRLQGIESRLSVVPSACGARAIEVAECLGRVFGVPLGLVQDNVYSTDPNERMNQLLNQSEDERQAEYEWRPIWFNDQPSHLTPNRVHGGILP